MPTENVVNGKEMTKALDSLPKKTAASHPRQEQTFTNEQILEALASPLHVSVSPHIRSQLTISSIMYTVILALLPSSIVGIYFFGLNALMVILIGMVSAVVTEALVQRLIGQRVSIQDGSAALTGLLLALTLPPSIPWWMVMVGASLAIILGKAIYGGLGNNPFNPALIGRVILLISFPVQMTTWQKPGHLFSGAVDTLTTASPLGVLKVEGVNQIVHFNWLALFFGNRAGCIGEVSVLAILLGAGYLIWKGYITWHIPVSCVAAVLIMTGIFWLINPNQYAHPIFHLLNGGLFLGACFMATDMVTSPMTAKGMLIFGAGIGIINTIIRLFGAYPEGMSFAILIMNATCPLIDKYTSPKEFGRQKKYA